MRYIKTDSFEIEKENTQNYQILLFAYQQKSNYAVSLKVLFFLCSKVLEKIKNNQLKIKELNEKIINDNLYLSSSPDILIRPGGEKRLSDFLLWQSAYTELVFLDKLWPEFTKEDLVWCIEEFKRRERRFGE